MEWAAAVRHRISGALHDVAHDLSLDLWCDDGCRGVCTHSARIWAGVPLAHRLMVLDSERALGNMLCCASSRGGYALAMQLRHSIAT